MKKILFFIILVPILLFSNSLSVIKYGHAAENISTISKVVRLSNITQKSLAFSTKADNIKNIFSLAVKEKKISYLEQFQYYEKFQNIENGDSLLLKALQNNKNLDEVIAAQSTSYKTVEITQTIKTREQMKALGMINDKRSYPIKNSAGSIIGHFKATDFYNTSKIVKMPSVIFAVGGKTSTGYLRNSKIYWSTYAKMYPKDLSPKNLQLIKQNKSPMVDDTWIKAYPNHKYFKNDILEHHHLHHNGDAVPLPKTLHRLQDNKVVFHSM